MVDAGKELELALPGYDLDGDDVTIWLISLPEQGHLYELSSTYAEYGYEPKLGSVIERASRAQPYQLRDKSARLIYVPPSDTPSPTEKPWAKFKYLANDGRQNGLAAFVWLHAPHARVAASDFDHGPDGWSVIRNGQAASRKPLGGLQYNRRSWSSLQWFISATDEEQHTDPATNDDRERWAFVAPPKFSGQHAIAYGGHLRFTIGSFSGDFHALNSELVAVRLFCANCTFNTGETFVVMQDSAQFSFKGGVAKVDIPLTEKVWLRDPKSTIEEYEAITQCEMIEALAHLSGMHITADFTQKQETIGIDNVEIIAGSSKYCALRIETHGCHAPSASAEVPIECAGSYHDHDF